MDKLGLVKVVIENEIVPVYETENKVKVVYGSDLHSVLKVKSNYREWINRRFDDCDALKNEDYQAVEISTPSGQSKKEHIIKLDTAKEMAMLERNDIGKSVRRYFINLEKEVEQLKEDNKQLYEIAVSEEELAERQYQADKIKYALRNVSSILLECNYSDLDKTVEKIIDVHVNLKKKDRYKPDQKLTDTEYKQKVKATIISKLTDAMIETKETNYMFIAQGVISQLLLGQLQTTNRSTGHIIASRDRKIIKLSENQVKAYADKLNWLDCHMFSVNYMYEDEYKHKTKAYRDWIKCFPTYQTEDIDIFCDRVDTNKPMRLIVEVIAKSDFDCDNGIKSLQDQLSKLYDFDDVMIHEVQIKRVSDCKHYSEGKIGYYLENII